MPGGHAEEMLGAMSKEANSRTDAAETARMVREEVILRPARRAAAFCAIVLVGLTAGNFAGAVDDRSGSGFEIRPEIAGAQLTDAFPS
jgi:hypothetical protein